MSKSTADNQTSKIGVTDSTESAYTIALLRSMQFQGVQFLRYITVDPYNTIRAKVVPISHLLKNKGRTTQNVTLHRQCSIAEVCHGGLPSYADIMIDGTGLTARHVLPIVADPQTIRILPYNTKSAVVLGTLHNQYHMDQISPYCTRSRLIQLVQQASQQHNIAFSVGVELEFCLVKQVNNSTCPKFVDASIFASTTTLNQQQDFLTTLYQYCQQQDLTNIELIHSESAGGQLEVVLEYGHDPVSICDDIILVKETIKALAYQYGMKALFLPKFDLQKAGNGMHIHMSIRNATTGQPIFGKNSQETKNVGGLSPQGESFVEGILQHLPGITGLTLPTVNSHRRIGKGCWTGSMVGWALEDKETAIRVCSNIQTQEWDHVECKLVDHTANPYLAVGALLQSGLAGIIDQAKLRPSLYDVPQSHESPSSSTDVPPLPQTLGEALDALESDTLLTKTFLGEKLSQAYSAVRRHELERYSQVTIEQEVQEALA